MAKCKHKESCGYEVCLDDCCPEFEAAVETNADRIRAMSNEELAKWLDNFFWGHKKVNLFDILKWLQQPAEDHETV